MDNFEYPRVFNTAYSLILPRTDNKIELATNPITAKTHAIPIHRVKRINSINSNAVFAKNAFSG